MWNVTTFTDMQGFLAMPNSYTSGWFWAMMLVAICTVIFIISNQKTSSDRAFAITGFGAWIFGTFLFYLGWITWIIYSATIVAMIIGIIAMFVRQEPEY